MVNTCPKFLKSKSTGFLLLFPSTWPSEMEVLVERSFDIRGAFSQQKTSVCSSSMYYSDVFFPPQRVHVSCIIILFISICTTSVAFIGHIWCKSFVNSLNRWSQRSPRCCSAFKCVDPWLIGGFKTFVIHLLLSNLFGCWNLTSKTYIFQLL